MTNILRDMKRSLFISLLVGVSGWVCAQTDRVTTLQNARTLVVSDSEGQRDYYQVTTAKPFVIRKEDGKLVLPGKQQPLADVKSLRLEVPQKFQLSEDSTTFTSYNVDRGLLALRRTLLLNKWNSLVVPVAVTGVQVKDAFGEDAQLAAYHDIIEMETEAQVNFQTIDLNTDEVVLQPNQHYLVRPTREPDIAKGRTSSVNYGTSKVSGPAYLIADAIMTAADKAPQYKTVRSDQDQVRLRFNGTYTLRDGRQKLINVFCVNDEGNICMQTDSVVAKAFTSWIVQSRNTNQIPIRFYVDGISVSDDAADIADVRGEIEEGRSVIYDLQGRQVINPRKRGLYVINGKKVFVK